MIFHLESVFYTLITLSQIIVHINSLEINKYLSFSAETSKSL